MTDTSTPVTPELRDAALRLVSSCRDLAWGPDTTSLAAEMELIARLSELGNALGYRVAWTRTTPP
ncbi:hypothetical protein KGY14_09605 [Ameyamaea chiangmaiensis]|uniref:Uncharacterized protein n=1 Tax=Ameyamaea chiangmaiensis TaxID=442969 RepID=A0A850P7N8_9PROT|nr:hypothetical protein [Ameyamaea chiangmaiensis]MBS4075444.1 hypothetical protein [Ameyamaea chiangmaiensis]NVN39023.1 hypothetical protein [Ameyamaea chiangmaiensis]